MKNSEDTYFTLSGSVATVTWEYIVDLQEIETLEKHYFFLGIIPKVVPPSFGTFRTQKPHFLGLRTPPPLFYGLIHKKDFLR